MPYTFENMPFTLVNSQTVKGVEKGNENRRRKLETKLKQSDKFCSFYIKHFEGQHLGSRKKIIFPSAERGKI